jgi:GH18 family chitinase
MFDLMLQVLNNWRHRLRKTPGYTSQDIDYQQIKKCIQIGLLCVKVDRVKRPTINQIIKMLERSDEAYQNQREVKSRANYSFIRPKRKQHLKLFAKKKKKKKRRIKSNILKLGLPYYTKSSKVCDTIKQVHY